MKMNKKMMALMMSFIVVGTALTGCGKTETAPENNEVQQENIQETEETTETETTEEEVVGETDPTPSQELFYVVTDGIELPASMGMSEEMFADTYGIDTELLDSYYVSMPMMNVQATEIAIFELKDASSEEAIREGIAKRQEALEAQWGSYLPAQLELVQNYQVAVKDNKVIFVISESADDIIKNFNELA